jgi:uncharacterized protein YijF (DUF1287 family)
MVVFSRKGEKLPITGQECDYNPGELVTWEFGGGMPHIGIAVDQNICIQRPIHDRLQQGPSRHFSRGAG